MKLWLRHELGSWMLRVLESGPTSWLGHMQGGYQGILFLLASIYSSVKWKKYLFLLH